MGRLDRWVGGGGWEVSGEGGFDEVDDEGAWWLIHDGCLLSHFAEEHGWLGDYLTTSEALLTRVIDR